MHSAQLREHINIVLTGLLFHYNSMPVQVPKTRISAKIDWTEPDYEPDGLPVAN